MPLIVRSGFNPVRLMVRERTGEAPLLSSFVFDGVRYLARLAISTFTSSVPLWNERPACEQNELPEDLHPFVRMSFRPEISVGSAPILPDEHGRRGLQLLRNDLLICAHCRSK